MKYFINDDLALSRPPEGPVASYIVPFAERLGDRGYGFVSMRNHGAAGRRLQQVARAKGD